MKRESSLLFGAVAAAILFVGIAALPLLVPGYDPVRQTVSEIGEAGSPAQIPFAVMLCTVALCLLILSVGLVRRAAASRCSPLTSGLIGSMAISVAGVGVFAFPHPLHNVFGLSELIGYQAPLAFALTWRRVPQARAAVVFSWAMAILVWVLIALNLTTLARDNPIWMTIQPYYGLVQRGLFVTWFVWCAAIGLLLVRKSESDADHGRDRGAMMGT